MKQLTKYNTTKLLPTINYLSTVIIYFLIIEGGAGGATWVCFAIIAAGPQTTLFKTLLGTNLPIIFFHCAAKYACLPDNVPTVNNIRE